MAIHNLMEDIVLRLVDETCDELEKSQPGRFCTSAECRQDVACFTLNRIGQHYVSSARGMAHIEQAINADNQVTVDIVTLIHEGIRRISLVQRPYYSAQAADPRLTGPAFNFPAIKGRVLVASTFEPLTQGEVFLLREGQPVGMIDSRWQNPFGMSAHIAGVFLFLPHPESGAGKKTFDFEISFTHRRYEELHHHFAIELTAEDEPDYDSRRSGDRHLADLFAAPLL
jgi:competence protein ComFB